MCPASLLMRAWGWQLVSGDAFLVEAWPQVGQPGWQGTKGRSTSTAGCRHRRQFACHHPTRDPRCPRNSRTPPARSIFTPLHLLPFLIRRTLSRTGLTATAGTLSGASSEALCEYGMTHCTH